MLNFFLQLTIIYGIYGVKYDTDMSLTYFSEYRKHEAL